jgi:Gpi18-like mannosyltransferase
MPLYLVFIMEKKARIYHLLWIPLVYAVSVLPAVISGESLKLVFGLYGWQMERFNSLSLYAPNIYQWLVLIDTHHLSIAFLGLLGMLLWGGGLVTSILLIHRSRPRLDREDVVRIAMLFSLLSPFLLPRMHERYFFSADVLSILYAFYFPRRWFVPLLVIGSSFLSYLPFLFGETPVGMPVLALTMGCALLTVAVEVVASLGSSRSTGDMGKTDVS